MRLKLEVESDLRRRSRDVALRRFEAEHRDRKLTGTGGQAPYFKSAVQVGYRNDSVVTALGDHGRAGNRLAAGTYNAALHFGGRHGGNDKSQTR
jgi:hypothetical protein